MRILISGGTGLVGSELGKALAAKGHQLFVISRSKEKAELNCPYPMTAILWDELDTHPELESIEGIINLAGAGVNDKRWTKKYKDQIYNSRINSTKKLVKLANEKCKNLKAFVSTSAVGIYGNCENEWVDEEHPKAYGFLAKVCQDWEAAVADLNHTRSVILRVGIVFSEKGGALKELVPPIQAGVGGPLAGGKAHMSWIDIQDLVNMYIFALEKDISGIFNAVAPTPETNATITKAVANHLGTSAIFPVPYLALRMVVGEMAPHLIENQRISSKKIASQGFDFSVPTLTESIEKRIPKLKGQQRRVIYQQWLPQSRDEVFPFFAEVKNLEEITPKLLNFKVLNSSTEQIEKGTIINYKLKINGIPVRWRTQIMEWEPPLRFVDNQEKGPYKKWYHLHQFDELAGGTLMTDRVDLQLPLGSLGYLVAKSKVLKDVNHIFEYRRQVIHKLYKS